MNSEQVFKIIGKMKSELIAWDEFKEDCEKYERRASITVLEELESRLRESLTKDEPVICGCGIVIASPEIYEKHKTFCGVANR